MQRALTSGEYAEAILEGHRSRYALNDSLVWLFVFSSIDGIGQLRAKPAAVAFLHRHFCGSLRLFFSRNPIPHKWTVHLKHPSACWTECVCAILDSGNALSSCIHRSSTSGVGVRESMSRIRQTSSRTCSDQFLAGFQTFERSGRLTHSRVGCGRLPGTPPWIIFVDSPGNQQELAAQQRISEFTKLRTSFRQTGAKNPLKPTSSQCIAELSN